VSDQADFRIFTVAEAEEALPLVARIMADLMAAHDGWRDAVRALEAQSVVDGDSLDEPADLVLARARVVDDHLTELRALGCVFKGFEGGLVDFYSLRDDSLVFLCWRMGETQLGYWHELAAGFAGRQPLDDHLFTGTVS